MPPARHSFRLAPRIYSRYPLAEVSARLARIDLVASDIDECLFPGFSQSHLGHLIFYEVVTRPEAATDIRFVPQLLHAGAFIRKAKLLRRLGRTPSNATLMRRYEHSMWGIPEGYFRRGARSIPGRAYAGVRETLAGLGRRAPVGLISFGIDVIADEFGRQLNEAAERPYVDFVEANPIAFEAGGDGRPAFVGYRPEPMTDPRHKREALERQLERHRASCPLVFGNGGDECEAAVLAGEREGLSIGFRPQPEDLECFDIVVRARSWRGLAALLERLGPM